MITNEQSAKKDLPMGVIAAAIGLLAVLGIAIFFALMKSDPAAQAPNPPPRFDAASKEAETSRGNPMQDLERGPPGSPPDAASEKRPGPKVE